MLVQPQVQRPRSARASLRVAVIGNQRTNLIIDKPPRELLDGTIAVPLEAADNHDIVRGLHVQRPIHGLLFARILALDSFPRCLGYLS